MNMRILSAIAALLCTLTLSAQITTPAAPVEPVVPTAPSDTTKVATATTEQVAATDSIAVVTAADITLTEDEHREIKPLTGLRKRMASSTIRNGEVVHGAVVINEHGNTSQIVDANLHCAPVAMNGYRIVIYMNNSSSARGGAAAARNRFLGLHTGEPTYLTYDNPYFKVTIGNFVSKEDAMEVLGVIKGSFPDAFIAQARINVMEFAK